MLYKIFVSTFLVVMFSNPTWAENQFSVGTGFGYLQSGLGVNIALKNKKEMKYLAVGFPEAFSSDDNTTPSVSAGWIQAHDFLGQHGIGFNIGVIEKDAYKFMVYGGPTYTFFYNGIGESGFNLGIAVPISVQFPALACAIQIGYQF